MERDYFEDGATEPDETTVENVLYLLGADGSVPEDARDVPESELDELDEVFFGIDLEERLSNIDDYLRSREDTRNDTRSLEIISKILGFSDPNFLYGIYENRGFSVRAVEELIYYTMRWKDAELGKNEPLEQDDVAEVAENVLPKQVRKELNEETIRSLLGVGMIKSELSLALGIEDEQEAEWFNSLPEKDRRAIVQMREEVDKYEGSVRGLYLIGWLVDQDFMSSYAERLKISLSTRRRTVAEMLNQAMSSIDTEGHLLIGSRQKRENQKIGFTRASSMRRFQRMVTAKRLCEHLALGKYRDN